MAPSKPKSTAQPFVPPKWLLVTTDPEHDYVPSDAERGGSIGRVLIAAHKARLG